MTVEQSCAVIALVGGFLAWLFANWTWFNENKSKALGLLKIVAFIAVFAASMTALMWMIRTNTAVESLQANFADLQKINAEQSVLITKLTTAVATKVSNIRLVQDEGGGWRKINEDKDCNLDQLRLVFAVTLGNSSDLATKCAKIEVVR